MGVISHRDFVRPSVGFFVGWLVDRSDLIFELFSGVFRRFLASLLLHKCVVSLFQVFTLPTHTRLGSHAPSPVFKTNQFLTFHYLVIPPTDFFFVNEFHQRLFVMKRSNQNRRLRFSICKWLFSYVIPLL